MTLSPDDIPNGADTHRDKAFSFDENGFPNIEALRIRADNHRNRQLWAVAATGVVSLVLTIYFGQNLPEFGMVIVMFMILWGFTCFIGILPFGLEQFRINSFLAFQISRQQIVLSNLREELSNLRDSVVLESASAKQSQLAEPASPQATEDCHWCLTAIAIDALVCPCCTLPKLAAASGIRHLNIEFSKRLGSHKVGKE